jgi:uncharacterized protein
VGDDRTSPFDVVKGILSREPTSLPSPRRAKKTKTRTPSNRAHPGGGPAQKPAESLAAAHGPRGEKKGGERHQKALFPGSPLIEPESRTSMMRFLLRIVPSDGDLDSTIRTIRGISSTLGGKAVNPKRVSYGAVEIDVFFGSRADFDLFLATIEPIGRLEFYRDLQAPPQFQPRDEAATEAKSLFNAERFWEAHEVLESQWRVANGDEKRLLQGLILACAAFVHLQKGERSVALGIAKRSLPLLSWHQSNNNNNDHYYYDIDVAALRSKLDEMVRHEGELAVFKL